jgi:pilus assembly protein CpaB
VVEATDVETVSVPPSQASEGSFSDPAGVVGRVLGVSVVQGQPLTPSCFPSQSSGANLAATLPKGKRAVSMSFSEHTGMESLLYPGYVVDVLVAFKKALPNSGMNEAISKTLLTGVQVLAIDDRTVKDTSSVLKEETVRTNKHRIVTLLVEPRQAEALQLAFEHGTVSLVMRNPTDVSNDPGKSVLLSALCQDFFPKIDLVSKEGDPTPGPTTSTTQPAAAPNAVQPAQWETTVIRGTTSEKKFFPMPES